MKKLHFDYLMDINYTSDVSVCNFTIKAIPATNERQRLLDYRIELLPETDYSFGSDGQGNGKIYGRLVQSHRSFRAHVVGDVEIGQYLYEEKADMTMAGLYRLEYGKTSVGPHLRALHQLMREEKNNSCPKSKDIDLKEISLNQAKNDYEKSFVLMHRVNQLMNYVPGATGVHTTAEAAYCLKKGVCQDYAHILVALLRLEGIAARYVCGLLMGEGASHAWVEALCNGKWIAFDPTNDCLISTHHIKLSHGRDASECAINRGIMFGGGSQSISVEVKVEEG